MVAGFFSVIIVLSKAGVLMQLDMVTKHRAEASGAAKSFLYQEESGTIVRAGLQRPSERGPAPQLQEGGAGRVWAPSGPRQPHQSG